MTRLLWFNMVMDAEAPVQGFMTEWVNAVAARCEAVDVITMRQGTLRLAPNVRVYSVGKEQGYSEPRRVIEFYRILSRLLRQHQYDAGFAHMIQHFAILAAPVLRLHGIPLTLWYAHKSTPLSLRVAVQLVDRVVSSSADGFRVPTPKITYIGQGIDTARFHPVERPQQPFTAITVGRVAPVKRLERMITAVQILRQEAPLPPVHLRLVGDAAPKDADYLRQLQQQVHAAGLHAQVQFVGGIPHAAVMQQYQQADVMLNMSATGSMDKAVLEAMACGLPVITANEAYKTLLAPWADHLLTPPDSAEALAERLRHLLLLPPEERRQLGADLRAVVVRDHSLDQLCARLLTVLTQPKR
jgi:glycosyltransferase involved in cell wall biosynthesis